jgi:GcrA cell cycle regulator
MEWSSERIEQLRSLWHDGLSASQIAAQLGGITRNAVIGKAHRLGLTGRPSPIKNRPSGVVRRQAPARPRPERRPVAPPVRVAHAPATAAPVVRRVESPLPPVELGDMPGATILTLTDRICKWPIGDPRDADFHFCGRVSSEGLPYCAEHARRAYQPPARRSGERDEHGSTQRFTVRR